TAGYVPVQPDRINFVRLPRKPLPHKFKVEPKQDPTASKGKLSSSQDPLVIPYEWMKSTGPSASASQSEQIHQEYGAVCLLWISEDYDRKNTLGTLSHVKQSLECALCSNGKPLPHFAVTGRIDTAQLSSLFEADSAPGVETGSLKGVTLYVTQSTT